MIQNDACLKRFVTISLKAHIDKCHQPIDQKCGIDQTATVDRWRLVRLVDETLELAETVMRSFCYPGVQADTAILVTESFNDMVESQYTSTQMPAVIRSCFSLLKLHLSCLAWLTFSPDSAESEKEIVSQIEDRVFYFANYIRLSQDVIDEDSDFSLDTHLIKIVKALLEKYQSVGLLKCAKRIGEELDIDEIEKLALEFKKQPKQKAKIFSQEQTSFSFKNLTNVTNTKVERSSTALQSKISQSSTVSDAKQVQNDIVSFGDRRKAADKMNTENTNTKETDDRDNPVVISGKRDELINLLKEMCHKENKERKNQKVLDSISQNNSVSTYREKTNSGVQRVHLPFARQTSQISLRQNTNTRRAVLKSSFGGQVVKMKPKSSHTSKYSHRVSQDMSTNQYLCRLDSTQLSRSPSPDRYPVHQTSASYQPQQTLAHTPVDTPHTHTLIATIQPFDTVDIRQWSSDILVTASPVISQQSSRKQSIDMTR